MIQCSAGRPTRAAHLPQQHAEGVHIPSATGGPTLQRLRRQVRSLHSYQAHCFHLHFRLCRNIGPSAKYCASAAQSAAMLQTSHHITRLASQSSQTSMADIRQGCVRIAAAKYHVRVVTQCRTACPEHSADLCLAAAGTRAGRHILQRVVRHLVAPLRRKQHVAGPQRAMQHTLQHKWRMSTWLYPGLALRLLGTTVYTSLQHTVPDVLQGPAGWPHRFASKRAAAHCTQHVVPKQPFRDAFDMHRRVGTSL
jgi:hypothetical protein